MRNNEVKKNWRTRVLDRLNKNRDMFIISIDDEEMNRLNVFAKMFEDNSDESDDVQIIEKEVDIKTKIEAQVLLRGSISFLRVLPTSEVPFHLQIIVPEAIGTSSVDQRQNFEISVWQRSIISVFMQLDISVAFFEFSTGCSPLVIDVFALPPDDEGEMYWRNAFEELAGDINSNVLRLKGLSLKGVFPAGFKYVAVSFESGTGYGIAWERSIDPRKVAIEVVRQNWISKKVDPPSNIEEKLLEFNDWPK